MPSPSLLGQFQGLLVGAALGEPPPLFLDALADWLASYEGAALPAQGASLPAQGASRSQAQSLSQAQSQSQYRFQPQGQSQGQFQAQSQPQSQSPSGYRFLTKPLILPWLAPWQDSAHASGPANAGPANAGHPQGEMLWEMGLGLGEAIAALLTDALTPVPAQTSSFWPRLEPLLLDRPMFQRSLRDLQTHLLQRSLLGPALQPILRSPQLHLLEQSFYLSYYALFSTPDSAGLTLSLVGAGFDQFLAVLGPSPWADAAPADAHPGSHADAHAESLRMARCFALTLASAALGARLGIASIPLVDQQRLDDRCPRLLAQGQRAWERWAGYLPDRSS